MPTFRYSSLRDPKVHIVVAERWERDENDAVVFVNVLTFDGESHVQIASAS